jgi:hypothetical protein
MLTMVHHGARMVHDQEVHRVCLREKPVISAGKMPDPASQTLQSPYFLYAVP